MYNTLLLRLAMSREIQLRVPLLLFASSRVTVGMDFNSQSHRISVEIPTEAHTESHRKSTGNPTETHTESHKFPHVGIPIALKSFSSHMGIWVFPWEFPQIPIPTATLSSRHVIICNIYTVEPVYNGHPRDWTKLAVIHR